MIASIRPRVLSFGILIAATKDGRLCNSKTTSADITFSMNFDSLYPFKLRFDLIEVGDALLDGVRVAFYFVR